MNPFNYDEWLIVASHGWLVCPICGDNATLTIDEDLLTGAVTFTQTCERYPYEHTDVVDAVKGRCQCDAGYR